MRDTDTIHRRPGEVFAVSVRFFCEHDPVEPSDLLAHTYDTPDDEWSDGWCQGYRTVTFNTLGQLVRSLDNV